jgi:uncharacterized protein involved in response to NO
MAIAVAEKTGCQPFALWSLAFRPFFLAVALWAALALALWMVIFSTGAALPTRFDPLTWHIHAMLFGFVLAAIAGFMLTAIPNWTGRHSTVVPRHRKSGPCRQSGSENRADTGAIDAGAETPRLGS